MKRFADWRLPLIFAVPILMWAGLLYALFQPLAGSSTAASAGNVTITQSPSPSPWHQVNRALDPTYMWPTPAPTVPCAHQTLDPMAITEYGPNHAVIKYAPALVCTP